MARHNLSGSRRADHEEPLVLRADAGIGSEGAG